MNDRSYRIYVQISEILVVDLAILHHVGEGNMVTVYKINKNKNAYNNKSENQFRGLCDVKNVDNVVQIPTQQNPI